MISLIKQLLLPPGLLILMLLAGVAIMTSRPRLARILVATAALGLYVLSTPLAANYLTSIVQDGIAPFRGPGDAQAIVILSAGSEREAPEFGGVARVDALTLERLRYGALIHRETDLPVFVSGGQTEDALHTHAQLMARSLLRDFGVEVFLSEDISYNTMGNAEESAKRLTAEGISNVILVTHAWHMKRAQHAFQTAGLEVVAAPTSYELLGPFKFFAIFPQSKSLHQSYYAIHEIVGGLWYRTGWHTPYFMTE